MSTITETAPATPASDANASRVSWTDSVAHVLEWVIPFSLVAIIIVGVGLIVTGAVN
jgi:hypothetical protein